MNEEKIKQSSIEKVILAKHSNNNTQIITDFKKVNKGKKPLGGEEAYATGKRKNSVARVWVKPGKGVIIVNKRKFYDYFSSKSHEKKILQPFFDTKTSGYYDVFCTIKGGGSTSQAEAITHGIAKALDCISSDFHITLRRNGFLTRDARVVERKKYGKHKARKSTQFSKR